MFVLTNIGQCIWHLGLVSRMLHVAETLFEATPWFQKVGLRGGYGRHGTEMLQNRNATSPGPKKQCLKMIIPEHAWAQTMFLLLVCFLR